MSVSITEDESSPKAMQVDHFCTAAVPGTLSQEETTSEVPSLDSAEIVGRSPPIQGPDNEDQAEAFKRLQKQRQRTAEYIEVLDAQLASLQDILSPK